MVVFLACRNASPEGPYGPGSLARLPYTLEGVGYVFQIDNPAAEPPFDLGDVWFYLRFARTTPVGFIRNFAIRLFSIDNNNRRTAIPYPANPASTAPFRLGDFQFPTHSPVPSLTVALRNVEVPHRGQYEFRLLVERKKPTWKGSTWRHVSSHFIAVE